jgi:hypothetical protein
MYKTYLPVELRDMIADYHDYDKYCKPLHNVNYKEVMSDIISMSKIMNIMSPNVARQCWGNGSLINDTEYYDAFWQDVDTDFYNDYWYDLDLDTDFYNEYWQHLDNIDYLYE